ncbi:MAG: metal ABC transporter ATP-binding protein [Patescibacteria group bacterium]
MGQIEIKKLTIEKSGIKIIDDLSIVIPQGEVVAVVGPNGAGKSTFVKALIGLERPSSGSININISKNNSGKLTVGYVPQTTRTFNVFIPATVSDFVSTITVRYPEIIEKLGINEIKNKRLKDLSGGQLQRVFLAKALAPLPDLLVLDEPTSALDPIVKTDLWTILNDFRKNTNTTILFVTHDMGSVGNIAQKLMYIDTKLVFYGTFQDFCKSPEMSKHFGPDQHLMCHQHVNQNSKLET